MNKLKKYLIIMFCSLACLSSFCVVAHAGLDYDDTEAIGSLDGETGHYFKYSFWDKYTTYEEITKPDYTYIGHFVSLNEEVTGSTATRHADNSICTVKSSDRVALFVDTNQSGFDYIVCIGKNSTMSGLGIYNFNSGVYSNSSPPFASTKSLFKSKVNNASYRVGYSVFNFLSYRKSTLQNLEKNITDFIVTSDIPIFGNIDSAINYIENGNKGDDIVYDPDYLDFEYNSQIGFDEFDVEVHASNSPKDYYIAFKYKPTDFMLANGGTCEVTWAYDMEAKLVGISLGEFTSGYDAGTFELDLTKNQFNFYPYKHLTENIFEVFDYGGMPMKYCFTGRECYFDKFDLELTVDTIKFIEDITLSQFKFTFHPVCKLVNGDIIKVDVDCLSNQCTKNTFEPVFDSNGNIVTTKDDDGNNIPTFQVKPDSTVNKKDYHYIDVTDNSNGDKTYKYYYINPKGISTEIDVDSGSGSSGDLTVNHKFDTLNVNLSGSIGGMGQGSGSGSSTTEHSIIIEDDDYKGSTLLDNVKNLYGYKDDLDTDLKDDGVLSYEKALFQAMPDDIDGMLGYTIGTLCVASILGYVIFRR